MCLNPFEITQTAEKAKDALKKIEQPLHMNSFSQKPELVEPIIRKISEAQRLVNEIERDILSLQDK